MRHLDNERWVIFKGLVTGRWRVLPPLADGRKDSWSFPDFETARAAFAAGDPFRDNQFLKDTVAGINDVVAGRVKPYELEEA